MFKRSHKPIKGNGIMLLAPIALLIVVFTLTLLQLTHVPGESFHLPAWWEMVVAGLLGVVLGIVILSQTGYERRDDGLIYRKPNPNFKYVIIGIIVLRIGLAQYFKNLDPIELSLLGMALALVYFLIWRVGGYVKFRKLYRQQPEGQ